MILGIIDYHSPLNILVSVKGHPFSRDAFAEVFESFDGISHTIIEQPASQTFMSPEDAEPWDALVFYDMPGIDFSTQPPQLVEPPESLKTNFIKLLEAGKGMIFLHHALAGWPLWPEYGEVIGGRFFYIPTQCRGKPVLDSGYRHKVSHRVRIIDTEHPIVEGLDQSFQLTDELYLAEIYEDDISPLLISDYNFDHEHFYSAYHAVTGKMFCNENWPHPKGSNIIAWTKRARNSPIAYLQPGDGSETFENPTYRKLLENAIRWVTTASDDKT